MARGIVSALILLVVSSASAGAAASALDQSANLRLAQRSPLTLVGTGFRARESVRVTVRRGDTRAARTLRADARGRFAARFLSAALADRCSGGLWASAVGARGSRAALKLPQPQCPPPLAP